MKVRQNLYIDRALSDALEAIASGPGGNKSRLVNDALADWLARHGAREIDDLPKVRLDRMSRDIGLVRRDIDLILESLALVVRCQLLLTTPLPDTDTAARAVGRDGLEKFVSQVGRPLAPAGPAEARP
ncbi:CopG family transcriptional regulator [Sphingomonas oligophenolica]|uniref:CopG family transcriptional regulator n=1 Tax=Sphingomonas oligophenolica TaxID=301154 RepID=A0ABU9YAQ3_9SPHN